MRSQAFSIRHFSLIALIAFTFCGCSDEAVIADASTETLVRPAKLIVVGQENNNQFLNYPATIQSQQLSVLSFEVGGVLGELFVVEAQAVSKGEVLAKLDQRDLQIKLKSAQAQYNNADAEYQRAVRLMKEDAISRSVLDQRKSKREVYKAELESAQKALQDSVLIAPYDGNIAKVSVKEKQTVQAGKAAIAVLGYGGLEATINLPASILAKSGGQKALTLPSYVVFDVAPNLRIPATFKEITLEADTASQTYALTLSFEDPDSVIILPGMNASVWFQDPSIAASSISEVSIPLTAITVDGDQKYVWLVNRETMQVSRRNIRLEAGVGAMLRVSKGLALGEMIVAAGVAELSEGMKVRPWSKK